MTVETNLKTILLFLSRKVQFVPFHFILYKITYFVTSSHINTLDSFFRKHLINCKMTFFTNKTFFFFRFNQEMNFSCTFIKKIQKKYKKTLLYFSTFQKIRISVSVIYSSLQRQEWIQMTFSIPKFKTLFFCNFWSNLVLNLKFFLLILK